jgi:hypothetical protein
MVLTSTIMMSMWWVGLLLSFLKLTWHSLRNFTTSKLEFCFARRTKKPPDPVSEYLKEYRQREEALGGKRSFWSRLFRLPISSDRLLYMMLALNAGIALARSHPQIMLPQNRELRNRLRPFRKNGFLLTATIKDEVCLKLRKHLADEPIGLISTTGDFDLVVDTGCTKTATGFASDFIPNTLHNLPKPIQMDGIAGGLMISQEGQVKYEIVDDRGSVQELIVDAYLIPSLPCRLFSPQSYFKQQHESNKDPHENCSMVVKHDKTLVTLANELVVTAYYDQQTYLPRIHAYKSALKSANILAMQGCVTEEINQNLTPQQKILLKWHFRLGHVGFATVQWLGRNGLLGPFGEKMGATRLAAPKCAACQFGKQGRTPIPTQHGDKDPVGSLTKDKMEPGQLVFADQYESRELGRAFTSKGGSSSHKFGGGTLFIDAASNYVFVSHQVGATAHETIQSKIKFEREALTAGVVIQNYHTDNGVFTSKEFMRELAEKGQGITLSGVSAQFQNGAAENAIKIVVRNARTMMIHATLRWPGFVEKDLWPMALSHAAYLFNITPNMETGVAPISTWTKTTQETNALRNSHTWGCPVYVLTPKLKDGQKIPKWEPRSCRGQYVGNSPLHASTVGLVRNLQTGSITPQFHLVYDDYFETVHSREDQEPANWGELLRFGRVQSEFDEGDVGPELPDEWLNPFEMAERTARRQAERDALLERQGAGANPMDILPTSPAPQNNLEPMGIVPQVTGIVPQTTQTVIQPQIVVVPPTVHPIVPAPPPTPAIPQGRPTRVRTQPVRFGDQYNKYYNQAAGALCMKAAKSLVNCAVGYESDYRYLLALLTDVDTGIIDALHPSMLQFAGCYKATSGKDPDLPTYREAMSGPDAEFYEDAMKSEIAELEEHGTWILVPKRTVPQNLRGSA